MNAAGAPTPGLDLLGTNQSAPASSGTPAPAAAQASVERAVLPVDQVAGGPQFDLVSPLSENATIADSTLTRIRGVEGGVLSLDLRSKSGRPYRVDVLRRDDTAGAPRPVAATRDYAFFLANGGEGDKVTDKSQGLAVYALAEAVQMNESEISLPLKTMRQHWGA